MYTINQELIVPNYWMPEILPEPTEEYNSIQLQKKYYTKEGEVKEHPRWFYENQSMVGDDYLYYNEGWKLYHDNHSKIEETLPSNKKLFLNSIDEWIIEEKSVTPSYQIYTISEELKPITSFFQRIQQEDTSKWILDKDTNIAKITWKVYDLNESEIELKKKLKWEELRKTRNNLLLKSDIIILRLYENSLEVHYDIKTYRQQLRDLPNSIEKIEDFNGLYPSLPNSFEFYLK